MSDIENLTIMFTDIVGFSDMVSSLSRVESERILQKHDRLLQKIIRQFGGKVIKSVGDSFLVTFRSPTDAVLCSMAIHDKLWEANLANESDQEIMIRVAMNTGEVRITNNDVFGEAVNIAARLEGKTPPGAIYITESVYLSMNRSEVIFEKKGDFDFKGIPQPVTVYQAKAKQIDAQYDNFPYGGAHRHLKPASRSLFTFGKMFVGLTAAIIAAFVSWWATIHYMPGPSSVELDKVEVQYRDPAEVANTNVINFLPDITLEIKDKADVLLKQGNYVDLKKVINDYADNYADNDYLLMIQGHDAYHEKQYEQAITFYETALKSNSVLARDELLSNNLVGLLDQQRIKASRLIGLYMSQPMLKALGKRTGQQGLRGRYDAFYLLRDSKNLKFADIVGLNIWDLRELQECKLKKVAVLELKRLNDTRALPALKEVVDVGFWDRFRYSCLRKEARAAVQQIENQDKEKNKDTKQ